MDDVEKVYLLQRVDVFRGVRSDHLGLLAGIAQVVDAGPGAVLMRDEDIPDALFVIARGEVTATVPGPASARLLRITRPALADLLVDSPELTVALLRGMAHRVDTLVAQMPIHSPMAFV